ncbi:DUF5615 family PIN-like protein [Edaphobacter albus]|uniref:DUF5615 family PIN-like protein n=1 Tax=Edaphobacter sp. 4G125 TaxID=2763071 RepID=UPI0016482E7A|nr:DUF5615 family PIN-like protein [Edaphobacter sp. 4G125]QNI36907.1 DUF5615 family PIN-like protein [Edaphobacter sp. 4G125]
MGWVDSAEVSRRDPPSKAEIAQVEDYRKRRAKVRFYADENFPMKATEVLRGMGSSVKTVQEVRLRAHPDENHAAYALRNRYVLVSCDRDYLDNRRFPLIHCPVIVVFDFGEGSIAEIRAAFRCLTRMFEAPQFYGKWMKIEASRSSWTESARFLNGTTARSKYRIFRGQIQEWVEKTEA